MTDIPELRLVLSPTIDSTRLNRLFEASWPHHEDTAFDYLTRSLTHVCAFAGEELVGFVNLAWDGNRHAFLLDTTVSPEYRHQGIGRQLVAKALEFAASTQVEWVHVDYEPELESFYAKCGFRSTLAGLVRVQGVP